MSEYSNRLLAQLRVAAEAVSGITELDEDGEVSGDLVALKATVASDLKRFRKNLEGGVRPLSTGTVVETITGMTEKLGMLKAERAIRRELELMPHGELGIWDRSPEDRLSWASDVHAGRMTADAAARMWSTGCRAQTPLGDEEVARREIEGRLAAKSAGSEEGKELLRKVLNMFGDSSVIIVAEAMEAAADGR